MRSDISEIVATTFVDIAEQLTFMLGDQVDKSELATPEGAVLRAYMDFKGDLSGSLDLYIGEAVCAELAANILGIDAEDVEGESQSLDALKETLNVVGGRIVREIGGGSMRFELTPPAVETLAAGAWPEVLASSRTIGFVLDETPVVFGIEVDGEED